MAKCKVMAFLLCENATRGPDGKVALHGIFDRIIFPRMAAHAKIFFAYYKVVVKEPCTVSRKVVDPAEREIPGPWQDSLSEIGPVQGLWALTTTFFSQPGNYTLELVQAADGSQPVSLANTIMAVDQEVE